MTRLRARRGPPGDPGHHRDREQQAPRDPLLELRPGVARDDPRRPREPLLGARRPRTSRSSRRPGLEEQRAGGPRRPSLTLATDLEAGDTLDGITLAEGDRVPVGTRRRDRERHLQRLERPGPVAGLRHGGDDHAASSSWCSRARRRPTRCGSAATTRSPRLASTRSPSFLPSGRGSTRTPSTRRREQINSLTLKATPVPRTGSSSGQRSLVGQEDHSPLGPPGPGHDADARVEPRHGRLGRDRRGQGRYRLGPVQLHAHDEPVRGGQRRQIDRAPGGDRREARGRCRLLRCAGRQR